MLLQGCPAAIITSCCFRGFVESVWPSSSETHDLLDWDQLTDSASHASATAWLLCGVVCVFRINVLPDNLIIVGLFIHRPMTYDPYTDYLFRMQRPATPLKLRVNSLTSNSFIILKAYHYSHTFWPHCMYLFMWLDYACASYTLQECTYTVCVSISLCAGTLRHVCDHLERQYFKNCVSQTCWDSFTVWNHKHSRSFT